MNAPLQLVALAKKIADAHNLYPSLICGLIERESTWQTWLNRYEPEFEADPQYAPTLTNEDIAFVETLHYTMTEATEMKNRCMSWGLMQVLGESARDIGFKDMIPSLCDPATGLEWGCRLFATKLAHSHGSVQMALQLWNGGGNPNYGAEVMKLTENYH